MSSLRQYLPILLLILVGFSLRIHDLEAAPLRGDEAFSAQYWSDLPLSQSLRQIARFDPHPPLAYFLFRAWALILGGIDSVFSLRFISAIGNTIGIPAMYGLAVVVGGSRRAGLLAALIWALHPYLIWHSQDFRNYAIWAGVSVATLWLGLRLIRHRGRRDWLVYLCAACFAALTFYGEILNVLAASLLAVLLARDQVVFLGRFIMVQLFVTAIALFSFVIFQFQSGFIGSYGGNLEAFALGDYFIRFIPTLTLGDVIQSRFPALWSVVTIAHLIAALLIWRRSKRQLKIVMTLMLLPLTLLGVAATFRDIFNPRYVLGTVTAFALLMTLGSLHGAVYLRKFVRVNMTMLALLLLSPWILLAGHSLHAYFNDVALRKAPAWDQLGDFLTSRVKENDLVIQLSVDPAFGYYYAGSAAEMALPAHPGQTAEEIVERLIELRGDYKSIYVVAHEQAGWPNAGVVDSWMRDNLQAVLRADTAGLPISQYMEWTMPDAFEGELAQFGDVVALVGFEFFSEPTPSGELLLWVYWKPISRTAVSLKSFVHIYDDINPASGTRLWSQSDKFPQDGRLDTRHWQAGTVYRDVYYLPTENLEVGNYQLSVGWYDPNSGERLLINDVSSVFVLDAIDFASPPQDSK